MELFILQGYAKEELPQIAETLSAGDIGQLVRWTGEKDDTIRYPSFLLLQHRSEKHDDVYPYWDVFYEKMGSGNAYQRSIGIMMLSCNAKWDTAGKLDAIMGEYLAFCDDEKPMVVRLCIQSLCNIVPYKESLEGAIMQKLLGIDLSKRKDTQQKLVLKDILSVLSLIKNKALKPAVESYYMQALTGALLDKNEKAALMKLLNEGASHD